MLQPLRTFRNPPLQLLSRFASSNIASINKEITINKQISVHNNDPLQKSPLLFIFGWGYGKKKHLLKYSELFDKREVTSVIITTSLINSLLRPSTAGRRESDNVNRVMQDLCKKNTDRDILFYSFSNGGCAISYLVTKSMLNCESHFLKNIKGQIYDSCPQMPNEGSAEVVEKAFMKAIGIQLLRPVIKAVTWSAVYAVVNWNEDVKEFIPLMNSSPVKCPQLFLFSKSDELAPYKDILSFIDERKARVIDVYYKMWDKSPHVGHLKAHPVEYKEQIDNFVDRCLNR